MHQDLLRLEEKHIFFFCLKIIIKEGLGRKIKIKEKQRNKNNTRRL